MKRIYLLPLASVIGVMAAAPAAAQDFSGFRAEARIGYDWVSLNADTNIFVSINPPITPSNVRVEDDEDGFIFAGEVGYDFQVAPGFTLGAYAGIDFSDADFCRTVAQIEQACLEIRRSIYVGARAGAQVGGSTMIYGKTGYSNGQGRIDYNDVDNVLNDFVDSGSRSGWHFGAGVEQNFGDLIYANLEFVHTIYSDLDFTSPSYAVTLDGNRSQVMLGLGVRF